MTVNVRRYTVLLIITCGLAGALSSSADQNVEWALRGYGTIGLAHANTADADFIRSTQPDGVGRSGSSTLNVDSRVGLQLDAKLPGNLSGVIQVVSQYNVDGNYKPTIEWANLKYTFSPTFEARIGRTVTSHFLVSDLRLVSFTYPWVRPPQEIYQLMPLTNLDGIDLLWRFSYGKSNAALGVTYGQQDLDLSTNQVAKGRDVIILSASMERQGFRFQVSYSDARLSLESQSTADLTAGLGGLADVLMFTPGTIDAAVLTHRMYDRYDLTDTDISLVTMGASYDADNLLIMAEAGRINISGLDAVHGYSTTAGYRFGNLLAFVTYSKAHPDRGPVLQIPVENLPPSLAGAAMQLNSGVSELVNTFNSEQSTTTVGVRMDFNRSASIKAQIEFIEPGPQSVGFFQNARPGFVSAHNVSVISIAVDFVF